MIPISAQRRELKGGPTPGPALSKCALSWLRGSHGLPRTQSSPMVPATWVGFAGRKTQVQISALTFNWSFYLPEHNCFASRMWINKIYLISSSQLSLWNDTTMEVPGGRGIPREVNAYSPSGRPQCLVGTYPGVSWG